MLRVLAFFLTFILKKIKHTILSILYLIFKKVLEFVPHLAGLIQSCMSWKVLARSG